MPVLQILLAIVFAGAAPLRAEIYIYDCSTDDRKQFLNDLPRYKPDRQSANPLITEPILYKHGDPRKCSIYSWCIVYQAKVKIGTGGAGLTVSVLSAPPSSCADPWKPRCDRNACGYKTEPLLKDKADSAVEMKLAAGRVTIGGVSPGYAASSGATGKGVYDFHGIAFAANGENYKIQFVTGYVFRQTTLAQGSGLTYVDTGATVPATILDDVCADSSLSCGTMTSCSSIGLASSGKKYKDKRGKTWMDGGSGCRPPK